MRERLFSRSNRYQHLSTGLVLLMSASTLSANASLAISVEVRGLLQGAYVADTGKMRDDLRLGELLPTAQPYGSGDTSLGYSGTETLSASVLGLSGGDAAVDWVLLELRSSTNSGTRLAAQAAILQADGDLVNPQTGSTTLSFAGQAAGSYYVALRHRNHLGVMTQQPVTLSASSVLVDFSSVNVPVFGSNARYINDGLAFLWGGDANYSNTLISNGPGNDTGAVLEPILLAAGNTGNSNNYRLSAYSRADFDMNGEVIYAGPDNDINLAISNVLLHPNNADFVSNYIVPGQLVALTGEEGSGTSEAESALTAEVLCDYSHSTFNSSASVNATSTATWSCTDDGTRSLAANGLPDHPVGTFPNDDNPNAITAQNVAASFTLAPRETDTITTLGGPSGVTGYVLNGVKIDANTAGSCDDAGACSAIGNSGNWSIEALGHSSFSFGTDDNNAHVQPGGEYHYHGMPEGFVTQQGGNASTMTLIGWAADGFPIYARYGYTVANDANSALKNMTGSYRLLTTTSSTRPSTDTYELGTFKQDWEYVAGSGDLDECNGRSGVTPEFPNGIYHYYATDSYPYFQRCVTGEVEAGGAGDSAPVGPPPDGGPPPPQ